MSNVYALGCLPDPEDTNDLLLSNYYTQKKLPKAVNWFDMTIPVLDQGNDPACVGYSGVSMKREHEKKEEGKILNFSGLDLYSECKKIDGHPNKSGTYVRMVMKVLQKQGVKDDEGKAYKIGAYTRINNLDELKYAIMANGFALMGVSVFPSFYKPVNGVVDLIEGEYFKGGHCVLVGAYDDDIEKVVIKNSWGVDWGIGGFGYLTYKYIQKAMQSTWTAIDVDNDKLVSSNLINITSLRKDLENLKINN